MPQRRLAGRRTASEQLKERSFDLKPQFAIGKGRFAKLKPSLASLKGHRAKLKSRLTLPKPHSAKLKRRLATLKACFPNLKAYPWFIRTLSVPPAGGMISALKGYRLSEPSPVTAFLPFPSRRPARTGWIPRYATAMATIMNANRVKADIDKIIDIWTANTDFTMKDVTLAAIKTDATALGNAIKQLDALELQIMPLRNQRDDLARKLNEICTRARAGIKGFYGPNSSQYEQAGGTRAIERKSPGRKASAAESSTPAK